MYAAAMPVRSETAVTSGTAQFRPRDDVDFVRVDLGRDPVGDLVQYVGLCLEDVLVDVIVRERSVRELELPFLYRTGLLGSVCDSDIVNSTRRI